MPKQYVNPAELQTSFGPSTLPTAPGTVFTRYNPSLSPALGSSNISTVTSKQLMTSAAVQSQTQAALSAQNSTQQKAAFVAQQGGINAYTDTLTDSAWHALQPGVMPPTTLNYRNRPAIRLYAIDGSDASVHVPPFTHFILGDVRALDQERMEVLETFGLPHFFTTGRFVRKYSFSGIVRNYPAADPKQDGYSVTGNAKAKVLSKVSQRDLLINFYEQYLRASACAQAGRYAAIVVDGHTFKGFVTDLDIDRNSNMELASTFAFNMVVFDRTDQSGATIALRDYAATTTPTQTTSDPTQISSATQDQTITVKGPEVGPAQATETIGLGLFNPGSNSFASNPILTLTCALANDILKVSCGGGLSLVYADGSPVNLSGSTAGAQEVRVMVTTPTALNAFLGNATSGTIPITIQSSKQSSVIATLNCVFSLQTGVVPTFLITNFKVGSQSLQAAVDKSTGNLLTPTVQLVNGDFVVFDGFADELDISFDLSAVDSNNAAIDMTQLNPAALVPGLVAIPLYSGSPTPPATTQDSGSNVVGAVISSTLTPAKLSITKLSVDFGTLTDLTQNNPFKYANGARLTFGISFTPSGSFQVKPINATIDLKLIGTTAVTTLFDYARITQLSQQRLSPFAQINYHWSANSIAANVQPASYPSELTRAMINIVIGAAQYADQTIVQNTPGGLSTVILRSASYTATIRIKSTIMSTMANATTLVFTVVSMNFGGPNGQPQPMLNVDLNAAYTEIMTLLQTAIYQTTLVNGVLLVAG